MSAKYKGGGSSGGGGALSAGYAAGASQADSTFDLDATRGGLIIDGTGEPTLVPLLIKTGKSISGIEVQATGTASPGMVFRNAAGVHKGAIGHAVSAGDWTLGSLAGDLVITGPAVAGPEKILLRCGPDAAGAYIHISSSGGGTANQVYAACGNSTLNMSNGAGTILSYGAANLTIISAATFNVSVNALAGIAGGVASAGNLDLASTTHATKGLIRLGGASGLVFDEASASLGIGGSPAGYGLRVIKPTVIAGLDSTGGTGYSQLQIGAASFGYALSIYQYAGSAAGSSCGLTNGGRAVISTASPLLIGTTFTGAIDMATNAVVRMSVTATGNVLIGTAALVTTATDGFLHIPGGAGTPTGVPTSYAGRYPLYWDTTNKKFYVYDGAWLGGTAPGVFS